MHLQFNYGINTGTDRASNKLILLLIDTLQQLKFDCLDGEDKYRLIANIPICYANKRFVLNTEDNIPPNRGWE